MHILKFNVIDITMYMSFKVEYVHKSVFVSYIPFLKLVVPIGREREHAGMVNSQTSGGA